MSAERVFIAKSLSHKLYGVEDAIDAALGSAAELAAELPKARRAAGLSAVVGQEAFTAAASAVAMLAEARQRVVELHNHLDAVRAQIGMRPLAMGAGTNKPPSVTSAADTRTLVQAAA